MATDYPLEGDEIVLREEYFAHMEKASVFKRGKRYKVLEGGLGNGAIALEDDNGVKRNICHLYLGIVSGNHIENEEECEVE